MKTSKLIEKLQGELQRNGDSEVKILSDCTIDGEPIYNDITELFWDGEDLILGEVSYESES